jgi:hypothetical protein
MTDYASAVCAITQAELDACDPGLSLTCGGSFAYLKVGKLHGVSVAIEGWCGPDGEVPVCVRDGVVMRFVIPRGSRVADLMNGLGEGGVLSGLIDVILAGHVVSLARDGATGRLLGFAEEAREALLEALWSLRPSAEQDGAEQDNEPTGRLMTEALCA